MSKNSKGGFYLYGSSGDRGWYSITPRATPPTRDASSRDQRGSYYAIPRCVWVVRVGTREEGKGPFPTDRVLPL